MSKIILVWFAFIPVPIINGVLREGWYKAKVGDLWSNIIGCITLSVIFLLYVFLFFHNQIQSISTSQLFLMGFIWLIMTLVFEFGIGLINHRSLSYMLADYNIFKGRLWPLVLLTIFLSPHLIKLIVKK